MTKNGPNRQVRTLLAQHQALEAEIKIEANRARKDDCLIIALKKRKLHVKDKLRLLGAFDQPKIDDTFSVVEQQFNIKKKQLIELQNHRERFARTVPPSSTQLKRLDDDIRALETEVAILELRKISMTGPCDTVTLSDPVAVPA